MKENKLTKKSMAVSGLVLILNIIVLALIVFICLAISLRGEVFNYIVENANNIYIIAGAIVILSLILYFYFYFEDPSVLAAPSKLIELFIILYLALILCVVIGVYVHLNARPVAFLALLTATLFGRRNASFFNIIFALLLFIIDGFTDITQLSAIESCTGLLITFCSGMIGIFVTGKLKTRVQSVLLVFVLLIPIEAISGMLQMTTAGSGVEILNLLMYGALGAVFSTMLYIFFLPVFEALFANLTVFRLRELTSDDAKLIRMLKQNAKGTYNHSVTVAQMAEACARDIGENSELARAAAFYHDVGKLKNPEMFTENQTGRNLHDELTPELSVDIIRSHTKDGAALIRKQRLPEFFADVAVQHHGTMPIKYFYAKALKMSDREIKMEKYSYPGPTPTTKIAAIIMIVDSVEAAARSMPNRSPEKVEELIRNIIEERLDMDQFDNCNITMKDLSVIKETLVSQITGVYHSRIAYPKLKISKNK